MYIVRLIFQNLRKGTVSFVQVLLLSAIAAATARFTLERAIRFYWRWAAILAALAVLSAIYMRFRA